MRPTRGLGSAFLSRDASRHRRVAPSYLALLRVEFAAFHPAGRNRRTRLCGIGPRLTADGRYPLPCAEELGLSRAEPANRPDARPSDRLADRRFTPPTTSPRRARRRRAASGRPPDDGGGTAGGSPVDRLVAQRVGGLVLGARHMDGGPAGEPGEQPAGVGVSGWSLASLTFQRPWSCSTMSFESSIRWTSAPRAPSPGRAPERSRRTPPRCSSGRRGSRRSSRSAGHGLARAGGIGVDEDGPGRGRRGCREPRHRSDDQRRAVDDDGPPARSSDARDGPRERARDGARDGVPAGSPAGFDAGLESGPAAWGGPSPAGPSSGRSRSPSPQKPPLRPDAPRSPPRPRGSPWGC